MKQFNLSSGCVYSKTKGLFSIYFAESVLDDVLQEVLVDVQLLQNQPSDDLSFSPMTLDGEDEEDEEFEGADPAL